MNFDNVKEVVLPEGTVKKIAVGGQVLWEWHEYIPYLDLDGTRIDTGIYIVSGGATVVELDILCPDTTTTTNNTLCLGLYNITTQGSWFGSSPSLTWSLGGGVDAAESIFVRTSAAVVYDRTNRKTTLYTEGNSAGSRSWGSALSNTVLNNNPLSIGRIRPVGFPLRVYRLKLYNLGTLVRDMVPVRRRSDGVECMYDLVTDTYFDKIIYT